MHSLYSNQTGFENTAEADYSSHQTFSDRFQAFHRFGQAQESSSRVGHWLRYVTSASWHCWLTIRFGFKENHGQIAGGLFDAVHWFSLVIHEPMFRPQYESVADSYALESQKFFLFLVSMVPGLASWYRAKNSNPDSNSPTNNWHSLRLKLFPVAENRFLELMDEWSLASLQASLLLGTYYLYHGQPNASLALLGVTRRLQKRWACIVSLFGIFLRILKSGNGSDGLFMRGTGAYSFPSRIQQLNLLN